MNEEKTNQVMKDVYEEARNYCYEEVCNAKSQEDAKIYEEDFQDVFHNAIQKLVKHLDKCEGQELRNKVNENFFFSTIVNNFKQCITDLARKKHRSYSADPQADEFITPDDDSGYAESELRELLSSLQQDSTAILQSLLRDGQNVTDIANKLAIEKSQTLESIDDMTFHKHRYSVRSYIKNFLNLSELSNKMNDESFDALKKQLRKSNPEWNPLKKAIKSSSRFDLQHYEKWRKTEYMDKANRNNKRYYYNKLDDIKDELESSGLVFDYLKEKEQEKFDKDVGSQTIRGAVKERGQKIKDIKSKLNALTRQIKQKRRQEDGR